MAGNRDGAGLGLRGGERTVFFLAAVLLAAVSYRLVFGFFRSAAVDFFLLAIVPAGILLAFRKDLKEFGLQFGDWRKGLRYSAALLIAAVPIMMYGAGMGGFGNYYPIWKPALLSWKNFVVFELVIGAGMFATEWFYRGFLLFSLRKKWYGNLLHSLLYMLVHVGKPLWEVPYSFFAGYVFGWVDLECNSILPSFLMHWLSSIVFDLMVIWVWFG